MFFSKAFENPNEMEKLLKMAEEFKLKKNNIIILKY